MNFYIEHKACKSQKTKDAIPTNSRRFILHIAIIVAREGYFCYLWGRYYDAANAQNIKTR